MADELEVIALALREGRCTCVAVQASYLEAEPDPDDPGGVFELRKYITTFDDAHELLGLMAHHSAKIAHDIFFELPDD